MDNTRPDINRESNRVHICFLEGAHRVETDAFECFGLVSCPQAAKMRELQQLIRNRRPHKYGIPEVVYVGSLSEVPVVWEGSYEEILRFKNHGTELIRFRVVRMETAMMMMMMMMMMMVTHSEEDEEGVLYVQIAVRVEQHTTTLHRFLHQ